MPRQLRAFGVAVIQRWPRHPISHIALAPRPCVHAAVREIIAQKLRNLFGSSIPAAVQE
jgi:hypothetical protein